MFEYWDEISPGRTKSAFTRSLSLPAAAALVIGLPHARARAPSFLAPSLNFAPQLPSYPPGIRARVLLGCFVVPFVRCVPRSILKNIRTFQLPSFRCSVFVLGNHDDDTGAGMGRFWA